MGKGEEERGPRREGGQEPGADGEVIAPFPEACLEFKVAVTHLLLTRAAAVWQQQCFYGTSRACPSLSSFIPLPSRSPTPLGRREPVVRDTGEERAEITFLHLLKLLQSLRV